MSLFIASGCRKPLLLLQCLQCEHQNSVYYKTQLYVKEVLTLYINLSNRGGNLNSEAQTEIEENGRKRSCHNSKIYKHFRYLFSRFMCSV